MSNSSVKQFSHSLYHREEAERFGDSCARPVGRELVLMDLRPNFFYQFEYSGDIVAGHVGRDHVLAMRMPYVILFHTHPIALVGVFARVFLMIQILQILD
jgi:hypothetical protein